MKLSVALIVYELRRNAKPPEIVRNDHSDEHAGIAGIRFLRDEPYRQDVLYIGSPGAVGRASHLPAHLFITGLPGTPKISGAIYVNLTVPELVNAIEEIFYRYNEIDSELNDAVARNESLRTILSIGARFFNNPITINDLRMRFIETSDNAVRELMPDYFKVVLDTGYIDIRIMTAMKNKGYDRLINSSRETLLFELEEIPVRYFSKNIYESGQITACLVVHEVFTPVDMAQTILVEQITQVVDHYAFKNSRGKPTSANKVEQIVRTLLEGAKYNEEIHALYLKQMNWGENDGYYVIKIQVSPENVTMNTARYTFASAQSFFPGSIIVEYDDSGVIVLCAAQIRYDLKAALKNLEKYVKERRDKVAVSRKFQSFGAIYEQSRALSEAMQLGMILDPGRCLYAFDNYSLPLLLKICSSEFDLRVFCLYEAVMLYEYDKANGSDFFKSLYVYLRHSRSLASAADELKIHRNTLLYRLGRVTEISGVDPADNEILLPMILSYEILRYRLKLE